MKNRTNQRIDELYQGIKDELGTVCVCIESDPKKAINYCDKIVEQVEVLKQIIKNIRDKNAK